MIDLCRLNSFVENCPFFFSNGEHFLSEDTSEKGRLYAMHRPKGCCISFCQRTQVLTKIPVFPMEKQMLCLPRPVIWAKYRPQGIYKANKTHSRLRAEKRYSNNRLPGRLPSPGLIHKRVKSKHSTNTRYSAVARFFTIIWEKSMVVPTQSLTFLGLSIDSQSMSLSLLEKKIMNIQSKCQSHSQSHFYQLAKLQAS